MNELALFGIVLVFSVFIFPGPLLVLGMRSTARRRAAEAALVGGYQEPEPAPQRQRQPRPAVDQAARIAPAQPIYVAPVPITPPAQPAVKVLPLGDTLKALVAGLHILIVAESNAGKSTAAQAVLVGRVKAGDKVLILDPHADLTTWNGITAIGLGRQYDPIGTAMDQLLAEMNTRFQRKALGDTSYPSLTIFIDEWPGIQRHCKNAGHFMTELAQEGRKVNMRLVIMTQSDRVESLGLSGKGDVRGNFTFLFLGKKAVGALPDTATMTRPAVISEDGHIMAATVDGLDRYKSVTIDPQAVYPLVSIIPEPVCEPEPASELIDFDAERAFWLGGTDEDTQETAKAFHAQNQPNHQPEPVAVPPQTQPEPVRESAAVPPIAPALLAEMETALIEKCLTRGMSANAIASKLGGTRTTRLAQIRTIKEAMETELASNSEELLANAGNIRPLQIGDLDQ